MQWVECVPNFSEGRDQDVIQAITKAISQVEGVLLLQAQAMVEEAFVRDPAIDCLYEPAEDSCAHHL